MAGESFEKMRKRVLREHKHSIVRLGLKGHRDKGRGLVMVKCTEVGKMHLSYLTLDRLKCLHGNGGQEDHGHGARLIEKISAYSPGAEIPVLVTDGESERLSVGVRQGPKQHQG